MHAVENREAAIRDSFIAGISSNYVQQRSLEGNILELQAAYDKAQSLDDSQRNAESFVSSTSLESFLTFIRSWSATIIRIKQVKKNVWQRDRCNQRVAEKPKTHLACPTECRIR